MLVEVSGTRGDGQQQWPPKGDVIDLPDEEGADLVKAGLAEPVKDDKVEKATAPKAETRGSH